MIRKSHNWQRPDLEILISCFIAIKHDNVTFLDMARKIYVYGINFIEYLSP